MRKKLNLGIVGCGDIAGYTALFARLNHRIRIAACCDTNTLAAQSFAKRHKITSVFEDYQVMLQSEDLDTVYLAVPHNLHYPMIKAAIEAGVPVLVEKPITCTLGEGIEIVNLAQKAGVKLGVNYQYRYDSGCYALAKAAQNGGLGKIYYARCNIPWRRAEDYFRNSSWHANLVTSCGGTLLTQGSHILDIAIWAMGGQPVNTSGSVVKVKYKDVEVEDLAFGIVELDNGALIQISSSMVANPEQALSIEIYGEKGTAIYTDKPLPKVKFRGVHVRGVKPPVRGIHALQRSLEGFRKWIMEDIPYLTPGTEAIPVLAAVHGIYKSSLSGHQESIELPGF